MLTISQPTVKEWLSLLETSFILFRLPPYFKNIGKRLIKSPKIYFYDVGLASHLLGIENEKQVLSHSLKGGLFENLVITEFIKYRCNLGYDNNLMFYRDSKGNEVDLVVPRQEQDIPVEIKAGSSLTKDYFKGINHYTKATGHKEASYLVYNGDLKQTRDHQILTFPYEDLGKLILDIYKS